jgi:peptide deformylase
MKIINDILTLGDPRLYENCEPVSREELPQVMEWV